MGEERLEPPDPKPPELPKNLNAPLKLTFLSSIEPGHVIPECHVDPPDPSKPPVISSNSLRQFDPSRIYRIEPPQGMREVLLDGLRDSLRDPPKLETGRCERCGKPAIVDRVYEPGDNEVGFYRRVCVCWDCRLGRTPKLETSSPNRQVRPKFSDRIQSPKTGLHPLTLLLLVVSIGLLIAMIASVVL
jgi:hypothetical protein